MCEVTVILSPLWSIGRHYFGFWFLLSTRMYEFRNLVVVDAISL